MIYFSHFYKVLGVGFLLSLGLSACAPQDKNPSENAQATQMDHAHHPSSDSQSDHSDHGNHAMQMTAKEPWQQAYLESMQPMHDGMMAGIMADDPDLAFAKGMLPHHQGAVDMARIELKYGKDPAMRALAESIIQAQESEIAEMQAWIKNHPNGDNSKGEDANSQSGDNIKKDQSTPSQPSAEQSIN